MKTRAIRAFPKFENIDKITVEIIGENQESIIEIECKLK